MLSGIPTSGKSTYVSFLLQKPEFYNAVVLSTDNYIEKVAKENNLSYNEVFENEIKSAIKQLNVDLSEALKNNRSIIHDQTNLTQKSRAKKIKKIPDHYKKICAYSVIDLEEAQKRNKSLICTKRISRISNACQVSRGELDKLSKISIKIFGEVNN
jgi:predicted kinase